MTIRVLLVDDDTNNLLTLAALLEMEGLDVVTATSVATARVALRTAEAPFDVLLVDQHLKDGHGSETIVFARSLTPGVKVLMLSGVAQERAEANADAFVLKGADFTTLMAVVRNLVPVV
jgi:DNA-binding response OmpR family regulator